MAVVEAGLPVVSQDAASCDMCAKHAAEAATGKTDRNDDLLPWGLALTGAVIVASLLSFSSRLLGPHPEGIAVAAWRSQCVSKRRVQSVRPSFETVACKGMRPPQDEGGV